jgi:hypothetical protein
VSQALHLAQINVARLVAPLDSPLVADFAALIDGVNALAERSPGFVWRLKAEGGQGSSYLQVFDDPLILVNLTVWESVEALKAFVFRGDHVSVMRRRGEWFSPYGGPQVALWWIEPGTVPSPEEAKARLAYLAEHGPTATAFTWRQLVPRQLVGPLATEQRC